jgi:hypothetical protein
MASSPYVAADGRGHVEVDWQAGHRQPVPLDFIIDTGATRSAVDQAASIGLTVKAYISVSQASGGSAGVQLLSGGSMSIQVTDSSTKQARLATYAGDVLQLGVNVIGSEVFKALSIRLVFDPGPVPPDILFEV